MGWQDRDYNQGREQMNSFFASPASILQWSVPIYKSPALYIRLHFWFLLIVLFNIIAVLQAKKPLFYIPLDIAVLLAAVLLHELGHRLFARSVGGNHWEWVLWPLGGMIPPACPRNPKALFIANIGGLAFTIPLAALAFLGLRLIPGVEVTYGLVFDPFGPLALLTSQPPAYTILAHILSGFVMLSAAITAVNLFPAYWFDGGYIWQSLFWPRFGPAKATTITCLAGMILAVPFFVLALWSRSFFGMILWALIFSDCFNRRRILLAAGLGVMSEDDDTAYNYMDSPTPHRKKIKKRWFKAARKKAAAEQALQAKIDAILDKVKQKGLHSLTWWEKRTLRKATERQRQQDLAERL